MRNRRAEKAKPPAPRKSRRDGKNRPGRESRRRAAPATPGPASEPVRPAGFLDPERAARWADFFRAIADPTRQGILVMLDEGELSATEIGRKFRLSQSTISRHLSVLRHAGLVKSRREGKRVIYRLECLSVASTCEGFFARMSCCAPLFRAEGKGKRGEGRCGGSGRGKPGKGDASC